MGSAQTLALRIFDATWRDDTSLRLGPPMNEPAPTYLVRLRPRPGVDAIKALRYALKLLGRRGGMVAVEVIEEPLPAAGVAARPAE
jgi:hypothetical protein